MIQEVIAYKNIVENIEGLIDNSPYKRTILLKKLGYPVQHFIEN